jgi:hypothetical protein
MIHFEAHQLADFVRGLSDAQAGMSVETHLSTGCRRCTRTADLLRDVSSMAQADAEYQVPLHLVHGARAIFALQQPEKVYISPRITCRLVFDSFRDALPVGVRSRHRLTRHALYQARDYSLDLRLEHLRGTPRVTLVGQVVNQNEPDKPLADLPVFLVCGRTIVARAISNAFGEFQVEYQPKRRLRLYIQANNEFPKRIEVPLGRFSPDDPDRRSTRPKSSAKTGKRKASRSRVS